MKKILPLLVIGFLLYSFTKKKAPAGINPSTPEGKAFEDLSKTIEADPVFTEAGFPADFYEAVKTEYAQQQAGTPRTPDYAFGLPGAFMSVADAWQSAMKFSEATHAQLWAIYSKYRQDIAKAF